MKHQGKIQDISIHKTDRPPSVGDDATRPDPEVREKNRDDVPQILNTWEYRDRDRRERDVCIRLRWDSPRGAEYNRGTGKTARPGLCVGVG